MVIAERLLPQTEENRAALRTAIAAIIAILLAFGLHLDKPYWSGITVVMLSNLYTGNILDKALMRLIGTLLGAWLGFFLAGYIANSFFLYLFMCFFLMTVSVYYYNFSKYAYAWLMAGLSGFIVISELAINPHEAFIVAVWRPVEICLGVLVSAACAFCVFPNAIQDTVVKEVGGIFDAIDALLSEVSSAVVAHDASKLNGIADANLVLKKKIRKATEMIDFMRREVGISRNQIDQFRFLLDSFFNLTRSIGYFISSNQLINEQTVMESNPLPVNEVFKVMQEDFEVLRAAFFDKRIIIELQTPLAMKRFDKALENLVYRSPNYQKDYLTMAHLLRQINGLLIVMGRVVLTGKGQEPQRKSISFQQQLKNDPDILIHSIKAGLTAILALGFWFLSNWPGGLSGVVSSIVISVRRNLFDMKNIGAHRLIGCILGGSIFLFSVFFFAMNLYLFVLIIFFCVWGFSFFSFKNVSHAYIGLQANMALIIAMAQEGGLSLNIAPPLERLGGVVIGIIASFLVASLIWRTDLLTMLQRQLQTLKFYLGENCKKVLLVDKEKRALYDLANTFWLCRGLMDSLESERLKRMSQLQLDEAKEIRESFVLLQATINNIDKNIDQKRAEKTAALFKVDLNRIERDIADLYEGKMIKPNSIIKRLDKILSDLLAETNAKKTPLDEVENCVAYLHALQQLAGNSIS
ncbi:MAG: FUSC family protein [Legionella sp.]|nr:FUSC family protein [Legionella sp.]